MSAVKLNTMKSVNFNPLSNYHIGNALKFKKDLIIY